MDLGGRRCFLLRLSVACLWSGGMGGINGQCVVPLGSAATYDFICAGDPLPLLSHFFFSVRCVPFPSSSGGLFFYLIILAACVLGLLSVCYRLFWYGLVLDGRFLWCSCSRVI